MRYALIFLLAAAPLFASAGVVINEVAWMGTANSASDEWIELYSDSGDDLDGWTLSTADGGMNIALSGAVGAGGYYLIERTDDSTVPNITADLVAPFGSGLANSGEILILKNATNNEINRIDASGGWPAGDNATKETMQKTASGWTTAAPTPRAENSGASDSNPPPPVGNSGSSAPVLAMAPPSEPRFSVDAGDDRTAVASVAIPFHGMLFDGAGNPASGGDFIWNFGDGSIARGANVAHAFQFPGEYAVFLSAAYGGVSLSDRLVVTVIANGLSIAEVKPGAGGWIEIVNSSAYNLDLSGWGIGNGERAYFLPQNTEIRRGARLVFTEEMSGIVFPPSGGTFLLYPNGSRADEFLYAGALKSDESFHRRDGQAAVGIESPGSDRFVARVSFRASGSKTQTAAAAPKPEKPSAGDQAAAVSESAESSALPSSHWLAWLGAAFGLGITGAAGYLFARARGIF